MANHNEDNVQHGLDDNPSGDAGKGAALGGLGGAAVGAAAGSLVGPAGTLVGAAIGAISGAVASGAAVAAVDAVDNDDTVSGVGSDSTGSGTSESYMTGAPGEHGHNVVTGEQARTDAGATGLTTGAVVGGVVGTAVGGPVGAVVGGTAGSLLGGVAGDASEAVAEGDTTRRDYSATQEPNMSTPNHNVDPSLLEHNSTTGAYAGDTGADLRRVSREEYDRLDADGRARVQLIEEELQVGKDVREVGEVEVSKRVVEEQVMVPVTLEREELVITRTAGTGDAVVGDANFTDEVITVPIREEFATVNKTAHVAEEVEIEKRTTQQQTTVGGTVRHEELEVEGGPQSNVRVEGDINRKI